MAIFRCKMTDKRLIIWSEAKKKKDKRVWDNVVDFYCKMNSKFNSILLLAFSLSLSHFIFFLIPTHSWFKMSALRGLYLQRSTEGKKSDDERKSEKNAVVQSIRAVYIETRSVAFSLDLQQHIDKKVPHCGKTEIASNEDGDRWRQQIRMLTSYSLILSLIPVFSQGLASISLFRLNSISEYGNERETSLCTVWIFVCSESSWLSWEARTHKHIHSHTHTHTLNSTHTHIDISVCTHIRNALYRYLLP